MIWKPWHLLPAASAGWMNRRQQRASGARPLRRCVALAAAGILLLVIPARAADTAFWKPYDPDDNTYALLHFDGKDLAKSEVKTASAEVIGEAKLEPVGKFGGCLSLDGKSAVKVMPANVLPGGFIAIEAWIKVSKYPEKEAYVVHRPAVVGSNPSKYDPKVNRTKGFALLLDSKGRLHLETTNCFYGQQTRTSSPEGVVPLDRWTHVAGVSDASPTNMRRLYVNGQEVQAQPLEWGQGLVVGGDEESEPGPFYVGNSAKGDAGLVGLIDEVRIHRRIVKFWPREEPAWAKPPDSLPASQPHVGLDRVPRVCLPLDGDLKPASAAVKDLNISGDDKAFVPGGGGKVYAGKLDISAPRLLDMREGSVEFWAHPAGVDNYVDFNRSLLSFGGTTFYIYNSGVFGSLLPLSLYFTDNDGQLTFVSAENIEFHSGRWYHVAITWNPHQVAIYFDGKLAVESLTCLATKHNQGVANTITFNPSGKVAEFAHIRLYDRRLLPQEVANCRAIALDGYKPLPVPLTPVEIRGEYLPSHNRIYYQLTENVPAATIRQCTLALRDGAGQDLATRHEAFADTEQAMDIPSLPDGVYSLEVSARLADGQDVPSDRFVFKRRHFPWEGNRLGVADEVTPPFEPIQAKDNQVRVVLRTCQMNGFGLWDKVVALDKDILAAPMTLRYETAQGEGKWASTGGKFTTAKPTAAVYEARAVAPPVIVETKSSVEIDGCMKVQMSLRPGDQPDEIRRLWLEIPLNEKDAPLMHTVDAGVRENYSGPVPAGSGIVWDGSKAHHYIRWLNAFVPYIWLGAEERGLAWFAENDKGWVTAKSMDVPVQQLVREGNRLVLRIHLINVPTTLRQQHDLVFGLQASPTKPMPENWRKKLPSIPAGLAVVPWGGLDCPYQGPYRDDWQIVDKLVEARLTGKWDEKWFAQYEQKNRPPPVYGNWGWLSSISHFAGRCIEAGPDKPIAVYQEEMMAGKLRPEWEVFNGEWTPTATFHRSHAPLCGLNDWPDDSMLRGGGGASQSTRIIFPGSYRDFGVYFADQWLGRGVSLYWDNTYPNFSLNPRISDAYRTDGGIQPAMIIWNQREYHKRVWNCLAQWRMKRKEPLEWTLHMTNTLLLPIHTWGTVNLDNELNTKTPFSPDWLRTETIGRQVGNMSLSLYPVSGTGEALKNLPASEAALVEWGMRAVHEIQRSGDMEKILADYGYGTSATAVHNYWDPKPALKVASDKVKWIVVSKTQENSYLIVLASWSDKPQRVEVVVDSSALGFSADGSIQDIAGKAGLGEVKGGSFALDLKYPYQVKFLKVTAKRPGPSSLPGVVQATPGLRPE
jgi:hypothetical protein